MRKKISRRAFLKAGIGAAGLGLGGHLLARNFDRLTRSSVRIFKNDEIDPYFKEVMRLSRQGLKAIKRY